MKRVGHWNLETPLPFGVALHDAAAGEPVEVLLSYGPLELSDVRVRVVAAKPVSAGRFVQQTRPTLFAKLRRLLRV
jgi:hypothetical protein